VAKSISGHVTDAVYERYHIVRKEDQQAAPAQGPENQINASSADAN